MYARGGRECPPPPRGAESRRQTPTRPPRWPGACEASSGAARPGPSPTDATASRPHVRAPCAARPRPSGGVRPPATPGAAHPQPGPSAAGGRWGPALLPPLGPMRQRARPLPHHGLEGRGHQDLGRRSLEQSGGSWEEDYWWWRAATIPRQGPPGTSATSRRLKNVHPPAIGASPPSTMKLGIARSHPSHRAQAPSAKLVPTAMRRCHNA